MKRKKLAERTLIKYPFPAVPIIRVELVTLFLVAGEPYARQHTILYNSYSSARERPHYIFLSKEIKRYLLSEQ